MSIQALATAIERRLATAHKPLVVGIAGSQGSGKSTIASGLAAHFESAGVATAVLSIDDLYLTRGEREHLAETVHPLLLTRGPPGTHDVALGLSAIAAIDAGKVARLPRFDKSIDDRAAPDEWAAVRAGLRLLILEGWCLGARPQTEAALDAPVNALEAEEDPDGRWRGFINARLAGDYQALFDRIDLMVFLAAPSFETVFRWREQQEQVLRARTGRGMTEGEVVRFIHHYERITRAMLADLPHRADIVMRLDDARNATSVTGAG